MNWTKYDWLSFADQLKNDQCLINQLTGEYITLLINTPRADRSHDRKVFSEIDRLRLKLAHAMGNKYANELGIYLTRELDIHRSSL